MSVDNLLPCPFCGGAPVLEHEPNERPPHEWQVYCYNCEYDGPHAGAHGWNHTKEHAISAWNRRARSVAKAPDPPPRYDDVFAEGIAALDCTCDGIAPHKDWCPAFNLDG